MKKRNFYSTSFLFFILVCFSLPAQAQIVNVLSQIDKGTSDGAGGKIALAFEEKSGNTDVLNYSLDALAHIKHQHHLLALIASGSYLSKGLDDPDPINKVFTHMRYRYFFADWLSAEAFVQYEFDEARLLKLRGLLGAGPRLSFDVTEEFKSSFGTVLMLEREIEKEQPIDLGEGGQYVVRSSSYLELIYKLSDAFACQVTMFYQPLLYANDTGRKPGKDHRILLEAGFEAKLIDGLGFAVTYRDAFNSKPFTDVKKNDSAFTTSLTFEF